MKDKYRITHYLPLVSILFATLLGLFLFPYDRSMRISLTVAMGISYFTWGIIHHYIHRDLSIEVALEYLLIAIFGVSAAIFVLM